MKVRESSSFFHKPSRARFLACGRVLGGRLLPENDNFRKSTQLREAIKVVLLFPAASVAPRAHARQRLSSARIFKKLHSLPEKNFTDPLSFTLLFELTFTMSRRFHFPDGRWISMKIFEAAIAKASAVQRLALQEMKNRYDSLKISADKLFVDVLTAPQSKMFHTIRSPMDFEEKKTRFVEEVQTSKMVSFDTESHVIDRRMLYVIMSSPVGTTLMFDLEALAGTDGLHPDRPLEFLPDVVKSWMRDPSFIILGSDIHQDVRRCQFRFTSLVDTRDVFTLYQKPEGDGCPAPIRLGNVGNKTGLGTIALWGKGNDHKPQMRAQYVEFHGPHNYMREGHPHWPWWRCPQDFYRWARDPLGRLTSHHYWYAFHDGTAVFSMLYRIVLQRACSGFYPAASDSITDTIRKLVSRLVDTVDCGLEEGHAPPPPVVTLEEEAEKGSESGLGSPAKHEISSDSDNDTPSFTEQATDEDSDVEDYVATGVPFSRVKYEWKEQDQVFLPWEADPNLSNGCRCCGATTHPLTWETGDVACMVFRRRKDMQPLCEYPRCAKNTTHLTFKCRALHHVCQLCFTRGHDEAAGCMEWSNRDWYHAREMFEAYADEGELTRKRRADWRFGFFCPRPFAPWPLPFTSYQEMCEKPVGEVRKISDDFQTRGIWPPRHPYPPLTPSRPVVLKTAPGMDISGRLRGRLGHPRVLQPRSGAPLPSVGVCARPTSNGRSQAIEVRIGGGGAQLGGRGRPRAPAREATGDQRRHYHRGPAREEDGDQGRHHHRDPARPASEGAKTSS